MPAIAHRLRQYAEAIADPSRGTILLEIDRAGELTPTQIARRVGMTPNNVYHHMRVLFQLGVVDPPRIVPGDTYVEKYYHINPEIRAALRLDPQWYGEVQRTLTAEDRQALLVGVYLTMANLLREAAKQYGEMDVETLDRHVLDEQLNMAVINRIGRRQLRISLEKIRTVLQEGDREFAEDLSPHTDVMLIAGLPDWSGGETSSRR
jgi:DNA-binding transcriptional ArsR family regulator